MKSLFRNTLVKPGAIIALAVAGLLVGGAAQAAGTGAGIPITNLATLNYTVGATAQNPIGSSATGNLTGPGTPTSFVVDNKINLTVATVDTSAVSVVPGTSGVATFTVTNNGNSVQDFSLSPGFTLASGTTLFAGLNLVTDNFNPASCSAFVESATVADGYQVATDTATFIDELIPDASKTVYVVCPIALTQINNDVAVVSLTATALVGGTTGQGAVLTQTAGADTAGIDIVFADAAGTDDAARNANHSSRDAFKVGSAKLTVTKTVVPVCDPFNGNVNNGAKNIPGSYVSYTISIANAAGAASSATLGNVTDTLVSSLALDPDLILINQTLAASVPNSTSTAAACNSVASTFGTATNASGNVNIVQTNRSINVFRTSSTTDSDGVGLSGSLLTVNLATVLPLQTGYTAGELKAGETVSVTFQAKIN